MYAKTKLDKAFTFLNLTQFSGAFNDNLFKLIIWFYLTSTLAPENTNRVSAIVGAIFVLPFLIFLPVAGKVADRFSKRTIIVCSKIAEGVIVTFGFAAFYFESTAALYVALFLMSTQSAFFSPAKYGIIPELVKPDQISRANSYIQAMTYLAIIFGTVGAPFIILNIANENYSLGSLFCVGFSLIGIMLGFQIIKTRPADKSAKPSMILFKDIVVTLKGIRHDKLLFMAVFASGYFLMAGGFVQMNLLAYGRTVLGWSVEQSGYLFFFCAIGIGIGAYWAGRLSGRHVELGIVPIGVLGLAVSMFSLGFTSNAWVVSGLLLLLGVSGGLYIVPINSFIQIRCEERKRGQVLAASGFLGWVGVLFSAGLLYLLSEVMGIEARLIFVIISLVTFILSVAAVIQLPDFLVRFFALFIARLVYRIDVVDEEKVPAEGGVLIVSNHVTWIDAVVLSAAQTRQIRFLMDRGIYNSRWFGWLFRLMRVIPISATDSPRKIATSLKQARAALDAGDLVCVFAEGAVTRTGMLQGFKSGFTKITKNSDHKIVPAYIGGAWGSIFSYYKGKLLSSLPSKFPYPISIHFGDPLPGDSSAMQVREKVMELSCDYYNNLKYTRGTLGETFVKVARKKRRRKCITDTTGKELNYFQTLTAATVFADKLKGITVGQERVGILLPPSVGGVLSNIALTMMGKVTVNLSYSASREARASAIEQCGIKTVITSKKFLRKAGINEEFEGAVYVEDFVKSISRADKFRAGMKAFFWPRRILANSRGRVSDDVATIIFSSGSTGKPKGIMLSHHNMLANIEAMRLVFKIRPDDDLAGVLPLFHSFGLTCSLWMPLTSGVSASFIPNPLDANLVGETVRKNKSTTLFAPPTFLLRYIRRCSEEDFSTLREIVVGAEKLKRQLADAYEEKFGLKLLEGYGATELSPVATLNLPDAEIGGVFQTGRKLGSAGQPLPGIAAKVVDIESGEILGPDEQGILMIKGPNVMVGYLNNEEETREKIIDGWYNTGDVASMDTDGFITITDRLSRFSKVGGEMVPHLAIEEALMEGLDTHEHVVAVTSVPDEKKGEQLVVLYKKDTDAEILKRIIDESELPNMWKPKATNYFETDEIPTLGSGKLDIVTLKKRAVEAAGKN